MKLWWRCEARHISTASASSLTSTRSSTKIQRRVPDRSARGLLDTNVVIDLESIPAERLPPQLAISALTLAELTAGSHATRDSIERSRRQDLVQFVETTFDVLPFDVGAARAFGLVYAAVASGGRSARGRRSVDLLIAATALANGLPLYTRNPADFSGLDELLDVHVI